MAILGAHQMIVDFLQWIEPFIATALGQNEQDDGRVGPRAVDGNIRSAEAELIYGAVACRTSPSPLSKAFSLFAMTCRNR